MYVPKPFVETRTDVLHAAIRGTGLATLVTLNGGGLVASHVPMILDDTVSEEAPLGRLFAHVARPNPQWRDPSAEVEALAIFLGPDAYISPNWYPSKAETERAVPTWNYTAVHAYGPLRIIDDEDGLRDVITRLTNRHEGGRPKPWRVEDAPEDYLRTLLRGIVGLEMRITRLEGAAKMSQNKSATDHAGVVQGLRAEGTQNAEAVAALMEATAPARV